MPENLQKKVNEIIDEDAYQVFLCICPTNMPFSFAIHPWFVLNKKGDISRWEVISKWGASDSGWGYLHKNFLPPFSGIHVFAFLNKIPWHGELYAHIEGEEAKQAIDCIENTPETYPYKDTYVLSGPNSNTYVQWVLDHCNCFDVELPWNAFGKDFA